MFRPIRGGRWFVHFGTMTDNGRIAGEMSPYPAELLAAVESSVVGWLRAAAEDARQRSGLSHESDDELDAVVDRVALDVVRRLRDLLSADVEDQRMNPLQVIRVATGDLTAHLWSVGCTPVRRDEFDVAAMPDDLFGIGPATWRDLGERVHEAGIAWGAWKAATIISRHRESGGESR